MLTWNRRQVVAGAALAPFATRPARAANYPERPIRVIIPYTAGGVAETLMRLLAVRMEQRLGQKFVIEAKSGAAGNIGTQEVARAAADGYTLLLAATNNYVINQFLVKLSFDPLADLVPVIKVADVPLVFFSSPSVPAKTLPEFIAYAKANPGKLNYATPSVGTVNHLMIERLKQMTGVEMTHVPFRGSPELMVALLADQVQLVPIALSVGASHLKAGKINALAVAAEKRLPMLPDVPTVIESGFPGFTATNWWGMSVPKGTPDDVVALLHEATAEARKDPVFLERLTIMGMLAPDMTRAEFAASLRTEAELWSQIIRRGKITNE